MVSRNGESEPWATNGSLHLRQANALELDLYRRRWDLELELRNVDRLETESRRLRTGEHQLERAISGERRMEQHCVTSHSTVAFPRSVSRFDSRMRLTTRAVDSLAPRPSRPMASFDGKVDGTARLLRRLQTEIDLDAMRFQTQLRRIPSSDSNLDHCRPYHVISGPSKMAVSSRRSMERTSSFPKHPRHDQRRGVVNGCGFARPENACLSAKWNVKKESSQMPHQDQRKILQPGLPQPRDKRLAFPMSHPRDSRVLTEYQTLIRQSLEFFQAIPNDLHSNVRGRSKRVKVGQVGVQCIYCRHKPIHRRERCSLLFPSHLWGVYQAAQSIAKNHLIGSCTEVPEEVRSALCRMRGNASAKTGGGKKHWEDSCREAGLYQEGDEPGIWLQPRFS